MRTRPGCMPALHAARRSALGTINLAVGGAAARLPWTCAACVPGDLMQ